MTEQCHCIHDIQKRACQHKDFCAEIENLNLRIKHLDEGQIFLNSVIEERDATIANLAIKKNLWKASCEGTNNRLERIEEENSALQATISKLTAALTEISETRSDFHGVLHATLIASAALKEKE